MVNDLSQRVLTPTKIADITQAVRAFCVVYQTSQMYRTDHAAFQSALEERMPLIDLAIQGLPALSLTFTEGQIRYAGRPLEPGSGVFQRVAQAFQNLGVENLTFAPGVDPEEMTRLIALMGDQPDVIIRDGLAAVLKREGFECILSRKPRPRDDFSSDRNQDGPGMSSQAPSETRGGSGGSVWDISEGELEINDDAGLMPETHQTPEQSRPRSIRHFVTGVLGAFGRREADPDEVAAIITTEFEHRLEERVAVVRRESEKKIRRLETVKELILAELERQSIAATIIDTDLQVLAMNALAESIIGKAGKITEGSPLERFIRSGFETQDLTIGSQRCTARLITVASSGSGSDIMLITLEKP